MQNNILSNKNKLLSDLVNFVSSYANAITAIYEKDNRLLVPLMTLCYTLIDNF